MGFREFITNPDYRRKAAADRKQLQNLKPPKNPSREYIDGLVQGLLKQETVPSSKKLLGQIGAQALPALMEAMGDPRFHQSSWGGFSMVSTPLESVLALLVPLGVEHVLAVTLPLIDSEQGKIRNAVALNLASTGDDRVIDSLAKLLQDKDGFVRSYAAMGIGRAVEAGCASTEFRHRAYDLLLEQCDQEWQGTLNGAPKIVVALDRDRAAVDFAGARWLSIQNQNAAAMLSAANQAGISLPPDLVRPLLEQALALAAVEKPYPFDYIAAAALESLVISSGESVRPVVEAALSSEQERIQESAARCLTKLAGMEDIAHFVLEQIEKVGFEGLTEAQRTVYCAWLFDAEVCNGGVTQFLGNSGGQYASQTLVALRELGHGEGVAALEAAIRLIGPQACNENRDARSLAMRDHYDELQAVLKPLESAYYHPRISMEFRLQRYALSHADDFRRKGTTA